MIKNYDELLPTEKSEVYDKLNNSFLAIEDYLREYKGERFNEIILKTHEVLESLDKVMWDRAIDLKKIAKHEIIDYVGFSGHISSSQLDLKDNHINAVNCIINSINIDSIKNSSDDSSINIFVSVKSTDGIWVEEEISLENIDYLLVFPATRG